jgi:hypothetical protein
MYSTNLILLVLMLVIIFDEEHKLIEFLIMQTGPNFCCLVSLRQKYSSRMFHNVRDYLQGINTELLHCIYYLFVG